MLGNNQKVSSIIATNHQSTEKGHLSKSKLNTADAITFLALTYSTTIQTILINAGTERSVKILVLQISNYSVMIPYVLRSSIADRTGLDIIICSVTAPYVLRLVIANLKYIHSYYSSRSCSVHIKICFN